VLSRSEAKGLRSTEYCVHKYKVFIHNAKQYHTESCDVKIAAMMQVLHRKSLSCWTSGWIWVLEYFGSNENKHSRI
jgi:hypothetical protein